MLGWIGLAISVVPWLRSPLLKGWFVIRGVLSGTRARLALVLRRRKLSEEAIGLLLEIARNGERELPETLSERVSVDELLEAQYVQVFQPSQSRTIFTRGDIEEAIEAYSYANRPRLVTTSQGDKVAYRLLASTRK